MGMVRMYNNNNNNNVMGLYIVLYKYVRQELMFIGGLASNMWIRITPA